MYDIYCDKYYFAVHMSQAIIRCDYFHMQIHMCVRHIYRMYIFAVNDILKIIVIS